MVLLSRRRQFGVRSREGVWALHAGVLTVWLPTPPGARGRLNDPIAVVGTCVRWWKFAVRVHDTCVMRASLSLVRLRAHDTAQNVWEKSTQVGCAVINCNTNSPFAQFGADLGGYIRPDRHTFQIYVCVHPCIRVCTAVEGVSSLHKP